MKRSLQLVLWLVGHPSHTAQQLHFPCPLDKIAPTPTIAMEAYQTYNQRLKA